MSPFPLPLPLQSAMPTAAGLASVLSAAQAAAAAVSAKPRGTGGAADGPPAKFNSAPPPTIQYNADVALALAANTVDDNSGKVGLVWV